MDYGCKTIQCSSVFPASTSRPSEDDRVLNNASRTLHTAADAFRSLHALVLTAFTQKLWTRCLSTGLRLLVRTDKDQILSNDRGAPRMAQRPEFRANDTVQHARCKSRR